jgi:hypothetical protein
MEITRDHCRAFIRKPHIHPITGCKIIHGSVEWLSLQRKCTEFNLDAPSACITTTGERRKWVQAGGIIDLPVPFICTCTQCDRLSAIATFVHNPVGAHTCHHCGNRADIVYHCTYKHTSVKRKNDEDTSIHELFKRHEKTLSQYKRWKR